MNNQTNSKKVTLQKIKSYRSWVILDPLVRLSIFVSDWSRKQNISVPKNTGVQYRDYCYLYIYLYSYLNL